MRTERNLKILAIVAITIAVGGLSVGFAAFSRTLNISNVTATVGSATWDVSFNSISAPTVTGDATANTPSIVAGTTAITGININLSKPGDSASYLITVQNTGDFNATATTVNLGTPVCAVAGDETHQDAVNVCSNLSYTLTYDDDSAISAVPALDSASSKVLKLTLTYAADTTAEELPSNTVTVTGLDTSILYTQVD